ncbi:MAG: hypothetical protein BZ151_12190, partial [Desulfobacca sp. 4484_104]
MSLTNGVRKSAAGVVKKGQKRAMLLMAAGILVLLLTGVAWPQNDDSFNKLPVFSEALGIIEEQYLEPQDIKKLIYGSIRGIVGTLDSHS